MHFCEPSFWTWQTLNIGKTVQPVIDASENVCAPSGTWHVPDVWVHAVAAIAIATKHAERIDMIIPRRSG
jgi:hypothetical protein